MITFSAPAKLNLFLHVMGKRADRYHLLNSLVTFLPDLCDTISLEKAEKFYFTATGLVPKGAEGAENLVVKAVWALAQFTGRAPNVRILLEKNIPAGAGLGGGSADAAAVIKGLEHLWDLSLSEQQRMDLLLRLGADVPVCYHARPARFEGIGEIISDAPPLPHFSILLIWPDAHCDTKKIFTQRPEEFRNAKTQMPSGFADIQAFTAFLKDTGNDLQDTAEMTAPVIREARQFLEERPGCLLSRMSGSGSCVFGIFEDRALCAKAQETAHRQYPAWWTHVGIV